MNADKVVLAVFTGTGNTLVVGKALADALSRAGKSVTIIPVDKPELLEPFFGAGDFALGLVVPVACASTYPTAWRFIDILPPGEGREAFFLASMGGMGLGMEGPIRRVLEQKGYKPVGARLIKMSGNYGKGVPTQEAFADIRTAGVRYAEQYAGDLLAGKAAWGAGGLAARFFAWLAHTRKPWSMFYRIFPIRVERDTCTGCKLCEETCPERNITMDNGKAFIGAKCQSCQRCVGLCPVAAIGVPGKAANPHHGVSRDTLLALLRRP